MGLFRRGPSSHAMDDAAVEDGVVENVDLAGAGEDVLAAERADEMSDASQETVITLAQRGPRGPWDASEVEDIGLRVDLGAIWLPGVTGMELRMEIDEASNQVTAVALNLNASALQVQAFAAPRTEGIWEDIRAEIAESVIKQGGSADDLPGPFGRELLARLPVRTPEGRTGHRPARFIGHDGPRWFLRGVLTGKAAVDPEAARALEDIFADIVVIRGSQALAPRDLLPLRLPGQAGSDGSAVPAAVPGLDPMTRGPEITEIH